jgi:hypothetical protein
MLTGNRGIGGGCCKLWDLDSIEVEEELDNRIHGVAMGCAHDWGRVAFEKKEKHKGFLFRRWSRSRVTLTLKCKQ